MFISLPGFFPMGLDEDSFIKSPLDAGITLPDHSCGV